MVASPAQNTRKNAPKQRMKIPKAMGEAQLLIVMPS